MKKTLLAAALLAGFATAGVAQAETSVTLYGILDTGYGYNQIKGAKDYKVTNSGLHSGVFNGNRWGLRGSEDLGDGLRAIFTLEAGFNLGNGESASTKEFHRQAFVGLASDNWGTFTMGRQYNMAVSTTYADSVSVSFGDMDAAFGGIGMANRMDNSFKYVTPNFSGFQAGIAYGNPNTTIARPGKVNRTNWTSVGLQYGNGPLHVAAAYDRQGLGDDSRAVTSWSLSGSYDFEVVKLALAFGQDRNGKMGWNDIGGGVAGYGTGANAVDTGYGGGYLKDLKTNNYYVGLSAPVGGGTLAASWAGSRANHAVKDRRNLNIYHINYNYPLSKRTSVYAYASRATGLHYNRNLKGTEAGVGLNHKF